MVPPGIEKEIVISRGSEIKPGRIPTSVYVKPKLALTLESRTLFF
jgi:hypothetical protein